MPGDLDPRLQSEIDRLGTVADKIRLLAERGYVRADIARILHKRYQHVRNVLEQDKSRRAAEAAPREGRDAPVRLTVGPDGSMTLPAPLLAAMELGEPRRVTARVVDGELRVVSPRAALKRARALVRAFDTGEGSPVDELVRERRAEAERE